MCVSPGKLAALKSVTRRLTAGGATGIGEKVREYSGTPSKIDDLLGELTLAERLSTYLRVPVHLQSRAATDIRLRARNINLTIEVEHKSSVDPFGAVFYPDDFALNGYETVGAKRWQVASAQLHRTLSRLPLEIEPWIEGVLQAPSWTASERGKREEQCGAIAEWLTAALPDLAAARRSVICHPLVRFEVNHLDAPPGRFAGCGMTSAYTIRDFPNGRSPSKSLSEWLAEAVERKNGRARETPSRLGDLHLVGLAVDDVHAHSGGILASTLLGGLTYADWSRRTYRGLPPSGEALYDVAQKRGRQQLLRAAQFDPSEAAGAIRGLFFDQRATDHIDGVLAIYYTGHLHLVPNPFSSRDIAPLCDLFPKTLAPFRAETRP